jgi:hypothetical protein
MSYNKVTIDYFDQWRTFIFVDIVGFYFIQGAMHTAEVTFAISSFLLEYCTFTYKAVKIVYINTKTYSTCIYDT